MNELVNYIETIIIGGGFSGLFISEALNDKCYKSFFLLEKKKNLGGYAINGNMKIGLLPAGNRTRQLLPIDSYEFYERDFINRFTKFMRNPKGESVEFDFLSEELKNKYYDSFILYKNAGTKLISRIREKIKCNILCEEVVGILKNNDCYEVQLKNHTALRCKYLIICTGRSYSMISILKQAGQTFSEKHDLLIGLRACFDSKNAEGLFKYQPDFKVKDENGCQTYCFNYKGKVIRYFYNDRVLYSGCLDEKSKTGNSFIGKRLITRPEKVLDNIKESKGICYRKYLNHEWPSPVKKIFNDINNFLDKLNESFKLNFNYIYYPALEQFWPRPSIINTTLESTSLPNVFYIGDVSGISFGILQCYITSHVLFKELENRNVFR